MRPSATFRRTLPLPSVFLLSALSLLSAPPAGAQGPIPVVAPALDPVSAPDAPKPLPPLLVRGLMKMLQETMTGQPVVAVGYGKWNSETPKEALEKADSMVGKLQALAEAGGLDEDPLIPYAVRQTWVLAPETRDEVNTHLGKLSPLEAARRGFLLNQALGGLTPSLVTQLGSEQGVAVARLPKAVRDPLLSALRPTLIVENLGTKKVPFDGREIEVQDVTLLSRITEPLDPVSLRIRARLQMIGLRFNIEGSRSSGMGWTTPPGPRLRPTEEQPSSASPMDLPVLSSVPNTYKPSDLEGKSLTAPIGISGAWKLSDVLDRAGKVAGLRLVAGTGYGAEPVFLGREDIPVGDVLDSVRLALTAAWRKMGQTYVLAWDKRGLGALQQTVADEAFTLRKSLTELDRENWGADGWVALAKGLPFAPDDTLALSDDQRRDLVDAEEQSYEKAPRIPFTQMTPDQQAAVRKRAQEQELNYFDEKSKAMVSRRATEDEVTNSSLRFTCEVQISVSLPGQGWVQLNNITPDLLQSGMLESARAKAAKAAGKPQPRYDGWEEDKKRLDAVVPQPVPAAFRALAVPALSPARVAEVVKDMQRRGLNALFYPALFGGYSTFPNSAFPLHPALRGADGWAAAEAAAKAAGIRLVGYVETLAWQRSPDRAHWLNRHPDWIDVDRAGVSRLAWLEAHPDFDPEHRRVGTLANYVRPAEPEVEKRLSALVTAFAAKKGAAGLALSDWEPAFGGEMDPGWRPLPEIGFAMPDRLAAVRSTGNDPIDEPVFDERHEQPFKPRGSNRFAFHGQEEPKKGPGALLAERLLARAKSLRPDWTTYLLDDSTNVMWDGWERKQKTFPKADVILSADDRKGGTPVDDRIEKFRPVTTPQDPKDRPPMVYVMWFWKDFQKDAARKGRILLDLRDAPERLDEVLAWITKGP